MRGIVRTALATLALAVGPIMLVWGWRRFARIEQGPVASDDNLIWICAPSLWEIVNGAAVMRSLGFLVVTVLGMLVTSAGVLILIQREEIAIRAKGFPKVYRN